MKDHLENAFDTIQEMCEYWGIEYRLFYCRLHKQKWNLEEALTKPVRRGKTVGKIINNLEILEKSRRNGQTWYKTKCLKCGENK